ncbi:MAG: RNA-guided endonuclease TnpB family protein [Spirulinaceae cyanobacterium]
MKARYRYRFYPNIEQKQKLAQLFGCTRVVWNDALALCKSSRRREKTRKRAARLHTKIKDARQDFLHKLSTKIIRENQTIILEDLNVSGMVKNRKLSRAISDLGWRSFRTMLKAKAVMYRRDFRVINRWEPTTQKCHGCGFKGGKKADATPRRRKTQGNAHQVELSEGNGLV